MKRDRLPNKSTLFLFEIIIGILFFSLAAALCIGALGKAFSLSREAKRLQSAVNLCSSAAEILFSSPSEEEFFERLESVFPGGERAENGFSVPLDSALTLGNEGKNDYTLELKFSSADADGLVAADIHIRREGEENAVYSLSVRHCFPPA